MEKYQLDPTVGSKNMLSNIKLHIRKYMPKTVSNVLE
jgi:hypothetical protein